ncbi:hypothetical protein LC085_19000 [Bacillus tianshenii]|uniref:hypothetical protein n=1 Tax=Sutcliffiella tianshenii TaxID=1463404 RepID=UPI001CD5FB21|nr:hypothetical protein [Bacillus tianshenii]MCA1321987.1 hypothetical protein [Bacillus tianshenii]
MIKHLFCVFSGYINYMSSTRRIKRAKKFEEAKSRAPQRMTWNVAERRGKLTKKFEAIFTGLFEPPL